MPPTVTETLPETKLLPLMVIVVPPVEGPEFGETLVTVGGAQ